MRNRVALQLSLTRAVFLAIAATAALAGPIMFGIVEARPFSRQTVQLQATQTAATPQGGTRGSTGTPGVIREFRIAGIKVTGAKSFQDDAIRSLLGMVVGDIYDESRLRKGFLDLKNLYGSRGYVNFVPAPSFDFDENRKIVYIAININEGRQFTINRIGFTGNTTTRDDVIRRQILFKEGEIFNSSLLDLSLLQLNQMGILEEIKIEDVRIQPSSNEPRVDIDIRVKEKGR